MKDLKIQQTTDYSKFKRVRGNREIIGLHAKRIAESMDDHDLHKYQPVMVSEDGYIIDGQHRVEARRLLNKPVLYVEVEGMDLQDIQRLNANIRPWAVNDFVESYCKLGKEQYKKLKAFAQKHEITYILAAQLLRGEQVRQGGDHVKAGSGVEELQKDIIHIVKTGKFTITNQKYADDMVVKIKEIQPFTESKVWRNRAFIAALQMVYAKGITHEVFMKNLERWHLATNSKIQRQLNRRGFLLALDQIANYGRKKPVNLI